MTKRRLGLFGLWAIVFGLMTFSAAGAQAEEGAQWLFAEKEGTEPVPFLEASLKFEAETYESGLSFVLHIEIEGKKILIWCGSGSSENIVLKANGSIGKGAKIIFNKCSVTINGVAKPECEPNIGQANQGVISTQALHALLELRELGGGFTDVVATFSPDENEVWAAYKTSIKCPIGPGLTIFGSLELRDCGEVLSIPMSKHLFEPYPADGGLWVLKHTAEHSIVVLGSWWAFLTGAHEGLKWSGDRG
jgi:hypothetical protein